MSKINMYACNYGENEIPGISLRDQPWDEAKPLVQEFYGMGYRYYVMDDGFMMFKEPVEDDWYEYHLADTEDGMLEAATNWWPQD